MAEKYFHISEILSITTGLALVQESARYRPDGAVKPEDWTVSRAPMIDVVAHISGQNIWHNEKKKEYDGIAFGTMLPRVEKSIVAQLGKWITKTGDPRANFSAARDLEEKMKIREEWVGKIAAKHGEWCVLRRDTKLFPDISKRTFGDFAP